MFYRKIDTLYPSVNIGQVRLDVSLVQERGITQSICGHAKHLKPYQDYTNQTVFGAMSEDLRVANTALSADGKAAIALRGFQVTYSANINMMDRMCTQSLDNTKLLEEILGGEPITIAKNQGRKKRQNLTTTAAGLSHLLSGYNTYELQQISSEVSKMNSNQYHLGKAVEGLNNVITRIQSRQSKMSLGRRSLANKI